MKTLKALMLFLFLLYSVNFISYAQDDILQSSLIKAKDRTRSTSEEGVPIKRNPQFQPAYIYLYNNVVTIDFVKDFLVTTITIINNATGEVIYAETHNSPTRLCIYLNGYFSLCQPEYTTKLL